MIFILKTQVLSGLFAHYQATKNRGASTSLALLYFLSILIHEPTLMCTFEERYLCVLFNGHIEQLKQMQFESPDLKMSPDFSICILLLAMGSALEEIQLLEDLRLYFSIGSSAVYHLKLFFSSRLPL